MKTVEDKLIELAQLAEELKSQENATLEEGAPAKEDRAAEKEEDAAIPKAAASKSEIVPDKEEDEDKDSEKNQAEIKKAEGAIAKTVKESETEKLDIGALFEGQELSEEFKSTAKELFEAVIKQRVESEVAEKSAVLDEEFEQRVALATADLKESLVDKVDGYLDFMVEQWMSKNELAINRGIKTEILESFVSGMKEVFESHYIDVPDEKYDLVEAAQTEVQALEARLDEEVAKSVELTRTLKEINRQIMIDEASEGMVETDAEKFRQLAEELTYVEEGFDKKLALIKESYFSNSSKVESKVVVEEFMTDLPVEVIVEETNKVDATMAKYLTAIERTVY
jgi:hypothetical protein